MKCPLLKWKRTLHLLAILNICLILLASIGIHEEEDGAGDHKGVKFEKKISVSESFHRAKNESGLSLTRKMVYQIIDLNEFLGS